MYHGGHLLSIGVFVFGYIITLQYKGGHRQISNKTSNFKLIIVDLMEKYFPTSSTITTTPVYATLKTKKKKA